MIPASSTDYHLSKNPIIFSREKLQIIIKVNYARDRGYIETVQWLALLECVQWQYWCTAPGQLSWLVELKLTPATGAIHHITLHTDTYHHHQHHHGCQGRGWSSWRWEMVADGKNFIIFYDKYWRDVLQHQRFLTEARDGEPEVIWIGDSIIQNLFNSRIWDSR